MCFAPIISSITAMFHFFIATFMLFYYRKSSISKMIVLIIYALGIYQFSEYMLCTSNTTAVWAKVGFITYTFLPAMGLDFALIHTKKKHNRLLVFLVPIIISLFVIVNKKFIIESFCNTHFVTVRHFFFEKENMISTISYLTYYLGFLYYVSYILFQHYKKMRSTVKREIDMDFVIGIFICLISAVIFLFIFPFLYLQFPSIYCEFGILFTVFAMIAFYIESKRIKK